eukprot:m.178430 g.178430  ORF g.178430 m.178430 type:complete len:1333 (+) comp39174_c0_seq2:148-4146(+)
MSDKLKQPIAWNSGGVQQKMKSSGLPGSTDESKSAAGRFATLSDPVVADECWHDVFEEELTVTLTSRATKYCRSHLQVFQHLCVRLGQEASVPVGCKDRQIKVSGSSEYLAEFSRQIHSEPSDLKDLTVSFAYDDACTRASGQNPSLSPIPRRSALEEEGFVESQTDVEELMTPSASLAANANYSPSLHKRPSGQSSHQKSPPATAQSLNQQSSEVQSENQKLQLAEKAKKAMRKNSDPESLSPTRSRPPPEADASSVSQKDVDDLTTPSDVANSNRSLFLGKQSETKSQNQKSQPSAQQKETSSQDGDPLRQSPPTAEASRTNAYDGDELLGEASGTRSWSAGVDRQPFQLNALTLQYVMEVETAELQKIEDKHAVKLEIISRDTELDTVMISVNCGSDEKEVDQSRLSKGYDKMRELFTHVSQQVVFAEKRIPVPSGKLKVVHSMLGHELKPINTKTLIEIDARTRVVILCGTQHDIDKTEALLFKRLSRVAASPAIGGAKKPFRPTIVAKKGDIAKEEVDVIVCKSGKQLKMDSDVARRILDAGGDKILKECREHLQSRVQPKLGSVVVTGGGKLHAKHVLHAVVEGLKGGEPDGPGQSLADICFDCLKKASSNEAASIAVPALGWGYPNIKKKECVKTLLDTVDRYWENMRESETLQKVVFIDNGDGLVEEFNRQLKARKTNSVPAESESKVARGGLEQDFEQRRHNQSSEKSLHPLGGSAVAANNEPDESATGGESESNPPLYHFQINSVTLLYLQQVRGDDLQNAQKKFGFKLEASEAKDRNGSLNVLVKPASQKVDDKQLREGFLAARDLCSEISQLQLTEEKMSFSSTLLQPLRKVCERKWSPKSTGVLLDFDKGSGDRSVASLVGTFDKLQGAVVKMRDILSDVDAESQSVEGFGADGASAATALSEKPHLTQIKAALAALQEEITRLNVDAIVCGANENLLLSTGLSAAICSAGGKKIQDDCRRHVNTHKHNLIPYGQAVIIDGYKLRSRHVAFAVIPTFPHENRQNAKNAADLLVQACFNALEAASKRAKAKSVAIPALGIGSGFSKQVSVNAVLTAVEQYFNIMGTTSTIEKVTFVDIDKAVVTEFERQLHQRKTGTSWELSAVRSAPSESAKGIRSSDRGSSPAAGVPSGKPKSGDKEEDSCAICIGSITNRKALPCGHAFCSPCIDQWFKQKPSCPNCFKTFGKVTGNQPAGGTMHHSTRSSSLPGFRDCGTIEINYHIPSGRQTDKHPNPGQPYGGTSRTAYLPDNTEGRKVLGLLKKAFDARLTFTVGTSRTTGAQNQVTWNDIHHKTSAHGGAFGYPDKTYLERVMGELKDKGIE